MIKLIDEELIDKSLKLRQHIEEFAAEFCKKNGHIDVNNIVAIQNINDGSVFFREKTEKEKKLDYAEMSGIRKNFCNMCQCASCEEKKSEM